MWRAGMALFPGSYGPLSALLGFGMDSDAPEKRATCCRRFTIALPRGSRLPTCKPRRRFSVRSRDSPSARLMWSHGDARLRRRRKISAPFPSWPGLSRPSTSLGRKYFSILSRLRQPPRQDSGKPSLFLKLDYVDGRDEPGHDGADRFSYSAGSPKLRAVEVTTTLIRRHRPLKTGVSRRPMSPLFPQGRDKG